MSDEHNPTDILGKKIFFLYPSATVQNQIIAELVQYEFEIYIIKDHVKLQKILTRYPESVVFVNINDHLPEPDCAMWIKEVMSDPATEKTDIGVVSLMDDEELRHKYLNLIKIRCDYTLIKPTLISQSLKQVLDALKIVDAKGRRKYIRVTSENDTTATLNIPRDGNFIQGVVKDISVVGLSCAFADDPDLEKNSLFQNIQIKLQTTLLKVEGIIFGSRMDGSNKIYVVLFTQRIDPEIRTKIRRYIQQSLQFRMEEEMKQL